MNYDKLFWQNVLAWENQIPRDFSKRCSDYPYLSSDTFRSYADFVLDESNTSLNVDSVFDGSLVYVSLPCLSYFFKTFFSCLKNRIILISSYHDLSAPKIFQRYLNDERLSAWFTVNLDMTHPKVEPIPVGLPLKYWNDKYMDTFKKARKNIPYKKDKLLYINYDISNNIKRANIFSVLNNKEFVTYTPRLPLDEYFAQIATSKFVLSPPGWGLDCFRTWESLLLHSIPVLQSTTLDSLFSDLPVVIVKNWECISEEFLNNTFENISRKQYHFNMLFADYWLHLLKSCQLAMQETPHFRFEHWIAAYKNEHIVYQPFESLIDRYEVCHVK